MVFFENAPQHGRVGDRSARERETFLRRHRSPAVEWIDISRIISVVELDYEMSRQPDSEHRHGQATRDLHIQHGKRNRKTRAPFQNLVETAIARVEEILLIAVEAELLEEIRLRFLDKFAAIVEVTQAIAQVRRELIQPVENRLGSRSGVSIVASSSAARSRRPLGGSSSRICRR